MNLHKSVEKSILEKLEKIEDEIDGGELENAIKKRNDLRSNILDAEWKSEKITIEQRNNLMVLLNKFVIGPEDDLEAVLYVENIEKIIQTMDLNKDAKNSILDAIEDIKDQLYEYDIAEARKEIEQLLKNLRDKDWKKGKITQVQKNSLMSLMEQLSVLLQNEPN